MSCNCSRQFCVLQQRADISVHSFRFALCLNSLQSLGCSPVSEDVLLAILYLPVEVTAQRLDRVFTFFNGDTVAPLGTIFSDRRGV